MPLTLLFLSEYGDDVVGLLQLKIVEAKLTRNTEWVGRMDPYLQFYLDGQEIYKTATKDVAGYTPVWNEETSIECKDLTTAVRFVVMDEDDMTADDVVGEGNYTLQTFCQEAGADLWLEV